MDVIFLTVPLYEDRRSQEAVEDVIVACLKEPVFLKAFAGVLVQNTEQTLLASSGAVRLKLLRWSSLLITHAPAVLSTKAATSRLAALQGSLLFFLYQSSLRLRQASRRIFLRLLNKVGFSA